MAKPGKWRTITPSLYAEIKAASHEVIGKRYKYNDRAVMKRFGIGKTTMQYIRNTKNYEDYCRRTDKNLVPKPPFESKRKYANQSDSCDDSMPILTFDDVHSKAISERIDREAEKTARLFGTLLILIVVIAFIALMFFIIARCV